MLCPPPCWGGWGGAAGASPSGAQQVGLSRQARVYSLAEWQSPGPHCRQELRPVVTCLYLTNLLVFLHAEWPRGVHSKAQRSNSQAPTG